MPGPFPGMDPYLEHPARWPSMHQRLITNISNALNALLPPPYIADIGERLYVLQPERSIYPDVVLVERPTPPSPPEATATAVMVPSDPPWVLTAPLGEVREVFVEILTVPDENRVIAVIEVLSPANKAAGSEGRRLYLAKQRQVLESQTHLVEIDFLRQGEHTVAAPLDWLLEQGYWDYLVSLHRGGQGGRFEAWPVPLRQRLPRIHIPLAGSDPDVVLELQPVFDRCYDEGPYARRLDYRLEPPVPLSRADAEWADQLLRERGLRA
jgi:uncharacterized protein DUF4058